MVDFKQILEDRFNLYKEYSNGTKFEFLSCEVFGFITYDSEVDTLLVTKALEVCESIQKGDTNSYIQSDENYRWYLIMINMPFFSGKLDWGTSVRGAWWDLRTCWLSEEFLVFSETKDFVFNISLWKEFIDAVLVFVKE